MAASLNAANEQHNPQQTPAMYRIYDGEYFEIIKRENDILLVRCLTCGPDGLPLRSSVKSNGNILKHIKRRHPDLLDRIREEKNIKARGTSSIHNINNTPNSKSNSTGSTRKHKSEGSGNVMDMMYLVDDDPLGTSHTVANADHTTAVKGEYAAHITLHVQSPTDVKVQNQTLLQQQQQQHLLQPKQVPHSKTQMLAAVTSVDHCENVEYLTGFTQMTSTSGTAAVGATDEMLHEYKPIITAVSAQTLTTQPTQAFDHRKRLRTNSNGVDDLRILAATPPTTVAQCSPPQDEHLNVSDDEDAENADEEGEEEEEEEEDDDDEEDEEPEDNLLVIHNSQIATNGSTAGTGAYVPTSAKEPQLRQLQHNQQQQPNGMHVAEMDEENDIDQYFDTTMSALVGRRYATKVAGTKALDDHHELLELRKQLMMREFELVQQQHRAQMNHQRQRHRLEMELLQRDLAHKRQQHETTMRILDQQLGEK